jgi:DNA-directed RNA polymerase subunit omega
LCPPSFGNYRRKTRLIGESPAKTQYLEEIIMLYPPVADLLKNVQSRYLLVNVVAQRARQLAQEAEELQEELPEKPVTLAIREVADGKLSATLKEEYQK